MPSLRRFVVLAAVTLAAVAVQLASVRIAGVAVDAALSVLIVAGLFAGWLEIAVFAVAAFWVLYPHLGMNSEFILFVAIPLIAVLARRHVPWRPRLTAVAGTLLGVAFFYLVTDYRLILRALPALTADLAASAVVALIAFEVFSRCLGDRGDGTPPHL